MRGKVFRNTVIFLVVAVFSLTSGLVLAADKPEKQQKQDMKWWVLKNKKGVCSLHEGKVKTPTTVAGPFATKPEAEAAKAKECPPKAEKPKKKNLRPRRSQVELQLKFAGAGCIDRPVPALLLLGMPSLA